MTTKNAVVLTSWGKNAGGGHLLRTKKLAKLLQSHTQPHTKPIKIDFVFLNSEAQSNVHNGKRRKKTWQDISEFRTIIAKNHFIIIDSYDVQSKHYQALLSELESSDLGKKDFCKSILILDDEIGFLRFVAQTLREGKHTPQNLSKLSNALRHIFLLNGGLGSEKLLRDFMKNFTKDFVANLASALDFRADFAKSSERLLSDFIKNNVFYGVKYFVANADFDFARVSKKRRIKHILLTFGASDTQNHTQKTIDALSQIISTQKKHIFDSKVCTHIVLGEFYPHHLMPKSINTKSATNPTKITHKIYQNLSPKDFAMIMKECDIAISAGGQSIYEIAQNELPLVIMPIATNQLAQSSAFAKKKVAILLDNIKNQANLKATNSQNHKKKQKNLKIKLSQKSHKSPKRKKSIKKNKALKNTLSSTLLQDLPLQAQLSQALLALTPKNRAKLSQNQKKLQIGKSTKKIAHRFFHILLVR